MSQKTAEHPPAESLLDFIRGGLDRAATERIGRHLAICRDCREFVERAGDSAGDAPAAPPATVAEAPGKPAKAAAPPVSVTTPTPKPTAVQGTPTPKPTAVQTSPPPPPKPAAPEPMKAEAAPPPPPKPAAPAAAKAEAAPPKPPPDRSGDTPQAAQTMGPLPRIEIDGDEIPPELRDHPRYELRHKLGAGGMGVVFLAQHKVMERLVALKVLHQSLLATPETVERFRREARAAARLDHPNIVKAFDAETVADWQILVMEFVEGRDLADATQHRGPFSVLHASNYAFQVAMGLQHAHEMDMVHRDLKPQNLMLTSKGVVKILDFGLAKLTAASHQPGLTTKDVVIGTPEFIAPEQARDTSAADIRSDIYSLGCTLYYFLTGEPPFVADTPVATVIKHLNDPPPRLESVRPDAPPELCALYWRMMSKDPAKRPQTPLEVAEALRPFAVKPGGASSYDSVTLPPPERPRTPYLKYALMFGVLLAAGAGAGILLPRIIDRMKGTAGAVAPADDAKAKADEKRQADGRAEAERQRLEAEEAARKPKEKDNRPAAGANAAKDRDEDADRKRREAEDADRKAAEARAAAERDKEAERKRLEVDEAARKKKEEDDRKAAEASASMEREREAERKRKEAEEAERKRKEAEEAERKKEADRVAAEAAARMAREKEEADKRAREPKALESLYVMKDHRAPVLTAVFSQDAQLMTTEDRPPPGAEKASPVIVWDILGGKKLDSYNWHYYRTPALAVSPDGNLVASQGGLGKEEDLEVWDPVKKRNVHHLFDFPKALACLTFSADGTLLGAVNLEERVTVWSMSAGGRQVRKKQAKEKNRESNPVTAVVLRADRGLTLAASGHKDGLVRLWSPVNEGDFGSITKLHAGAVTGLAFGPDGKKLASVSAAGGLRVTEGDRTVASAEAGGGLRCVAWTKDGAKLVTGGDDGLVRVWDAATGRELQRGAGHAGAVTCVAVAVDNKTYASGGDDKTVRVWSLKAE